MTWSMRKEGDGLERRYYFNDGTRDRAFAGKFRFGGRYMWRVTRLHQRSDGQQLLGGDDVFATFAKAKAFVVNNPGVWGN